MWLVKLKGAIGDLRLLASQLTAADVNVHDKEGVFYLAGAVFDQCGHADEARALARDLVQTVNGAARVGIDGYLAVELDDIVELDARGQQLTSTFRDTSTLFKLRKAPTPYGDAPALSTIIWLALSDDRIVKVLRIQESRPQNWVELYKVVEVIADDIGGIHQLDLRGWVPRGEVGRFTSTANNARVLGDEARHGHERGKALKNPMSLQEAQTLIRRIVHCWLKEKS
jgi:hypothetical protein